MPLDSRDKRASALSVGLPFRLLLPLPDPQTEDQGDRQQVDHVYRGILAFDMHLNFPGPIRLKSDSWTDVIRSHSAGATIHIEGGD